MITLMVDIAPSNFIESLRNLCVICEAKVQFIVNDSTALRCGT